MSEWTGPGFVDHHCHVLLLAAAQKIFMAEDVRAYHQSVFDRRTTPADETWCISRTGKDLETALLEGLRHAASLGLVEVTEPSLDHWEHFEAAIELRAAGKLPLRVKAFVRSGLADESTPRGLRARQTGDSAIDLLGVKFYADGWLGPQTCAISRPFVDTNNYGFLFLDATTLARRAAPYAEAGLQIATHAIGDRAIETVLDAYELIYDSPRDCKLAKTAHRTCTDHASRSRPTFCRMGCNHLRSALVRSI